LTLIPFTELADGPCAGTDELLLSLAAEFWPVDAAAARAELDDAARRLFGAAALAPADRAHRLAAVLERELRVAPDQGPDPELLRLDRIVHRRRGHPLIAAALGVELLRRAGVPAAVCSSPTRWFVGFAGDSNTILLDARLSAHADPCPDRVRRHCAHEVAFCVLTGLAERFARADRRSPARLALALRLALPVDAAVRAALQRDLDGFGPA
jgi:regulator of sirC expression with transglutaminase-like and TPR domain